jgi:hypothetical protein
MALQTTASSSPTRPEPHQRRQVPPRITQQQLDTYWRCRRLVEGLENQVRAGATAEPGPLTMPVLAGGRMENA